jgi:predicted glycoside hydrolase/deacetylase ChbG (UPF0249 family)
MKNIQSLMVFALAFVWPVMAQDAEETRTFAERLGWPEGSKVVIFHSDDAGMSHSSNVGTIKAMEEGLVTSCSTMMPCGWVPEFAKYLKENPDVDNGLHLTLTSEWSNYRWAPLAGIDVVPGLVDEDGSMWGSVAEVVEHATPDEVEAEIRAQIARAEKMGIPITHLDSHMGTLFGSADFFMRYLKVGAEKQIPIMVMGGHMQYTKAENPEAVEQFMTFPVYNVAWAKGLPVLDDLHTTAYDHVDFEEKKANLIEALKNMKPGLTMFIVHATEPSDVFAAITSSGPTRKADLDLMCDEELKKLNEDEGIILTTWRELMERRKAVGDEG